MGAYDEMLIREKTMEMAKNIKAILEWQKINGEKLDKVSAEVADIKKALSKKTAE